MKLGVLSFVAALLAAPLAAQAADSPARFAVTLRATVVDRFTYEFSSSDGECTTRRSGSGGRQLRIRSVRAARIHVIGGSGGVVYKPSRFAVRVTGKTTGGSFDEVRLCRAAPIERMHGDCGSQEVAARVVRARFHRPSPNRIAFGTSPRPPASACGLSRHFPLLGAWLDLAQGSIGEDALLNGRSLRVIARGVATREEAQPEYDARNVRRRSTVRWTLTFRRLD